MSNKMGIFVIVCPIILANLLVTHFTVDSFRSLNGKIIAKGKWVFVLLIDSIRRASARHVEIELAMKAVVVKALARVTTSIAIELSRFRTGRRWKEDLERVFVVDIYVSKGMSEVLNGKIMIISSGQSDAITRARPILSAMSEKLYVFEGALGAGSM
ncbi:hypothetical protein LOK49_LG02G01473 [Camellia lanceoleosa]|uniref:Uncharacterized protein n=1 Tax=Camellia lanceoleosa TaxID=1840588 RepID=A0ACC0IU01_9ERIC|nr:hypothetical protein LOK49_LG02G01473 [Camellia lanceoleosa]